MKKFTSVTDVCNVEKFVHQALMLKSNPLQFKDLGVGKRLGLVFRNPSLRTRLSTQIAAKNLGMEVLTIDAGKDSWALEFEDGAVMNANTAEHIREAAAVIGAYCDVVGLRSFPEFIDREKDYSEHVMQQFIRYCGRPFVSLESATLHPLQSLADAMTITEHKNRARPKVVLVWAPHVRALPQPVANSFAEWMNRMPVDFTISHPPGYELDARFVGQAKIEYNQTKALEDADFIYVKNWSSYTDYGKILSQDPNWMLTLEHLKNTRAAKVMHCLPVRRNVVISDEILDSDHSLVIKQAENRIYAAQMVLKNLL